MSKHRVNYKKKNYYNNKYSKNRKGYRVVKEAPVTREIPIVNEEIIEEVKQPIVEEIVNDALLEGKTIAIDRDEINESLLEGKTVAINTDLIKEADLPKLKEEKKVSKRNKVIIGGICLLLIILGIISFVVFRNKFKDGVIEFGTKEISVDDFLVSSIYRKGSKIISNLDDIDFDKVGEYDVTLQHGKKEQKVKLKIVDTTAPNVRFQNITQYTGYELRAEDFILAIEDLSPTEVSYVASDIDTTKYKDYTVKVVVKDSYGNETSQDCILSIGWLKKEVVLEVGSENTKDNLVVNVKEDAKKVPSDVLKEINTKEVGVYEITVNYDGENYNSTVKVEDTTPPELELKNVTVYNNKTTTKDAFIKQVKDNSGKVTTNLLTEMRFGEFGTQEVTIEAVDPSGNKTQKTANLIIKKDTTGPKFSGLSDLTVNKNAAIDYRNGVSANDAVDGKVDFSVDASKVAIGSAGTYYVTYVARDNSGNTTTIKRKVTVRHDQGDTNNLVNQFAGGVGNDLGAITNYVRNSIRYSASWGGDDPIWYGLTEKRGNCYVHAVVLDRVLKAKGYNTKLIWTYDKSHYWNLVYTGGGWRHLDSTPGNNYILLTDEEMSQKLPVTKGGGWDPAGWPAAN